MSKKLKLAVIREELVILTGDPVSALVLNQAILSHHSTENMDESTKEMIKNIEQTGNSKLIKEMESQIRDGWFYKSPNSFFKEIMISSRSTVFRRLEGLVEKGYLIKGGQFVKDFKNKYGKPLEDSWWKVDINKIRKDLAGLNFTLHEYPMWNEEDEKRVYGGVEVEDISPDEENTPVHGEHPPVHDEHPPVHGEQDPVHGGQQQRYYKESSKDSSIDTCKTNQSIIDEIIEYGFPKNIEKTLKEMVGRLVSDEIKISDIHRHYESLKEEFSSREYDLTLYDLLNDAKGKINKFSSIMNIWLEKARKLKYKIAETEASKSKPVSREESESEVVDKPIPEDQQQDNGSRFLELELKLKEAKKLKEELGIKAI